MIVVIPSNRSLNLQYLEPLIQCGARFIVVDDTEGSITIDHPSFRVFNWKDRRRMLGEWDEGFPRRNGASRDFGFYIAWREADANEIIVALDDDCRVDYEDFGAQVESVLTSAPRPVARVSGAHLNILDLYKDVAPDLFPRGFPYSKRIGYTGAQMDPAEDVNVTFSLGLWRNLFDVNAIDKVNGPPFAYPEGKLHHPSVVIGKGHLISVCSMNMHFRKEVIPAVYQLPMHVEVMPHWVIDRYGDIWGGFILKRLMDIKGEGMAAGEPMITHLKEGNIQRNMWQEHIAHLVDDEMIDVIDAISSEIHPASYLDMMDHFSESLPAHSEKASPLLKGYLAHLARAMNMWVKALR